MMKRVLQVLALLLISGGWLLLAPAPHPWTTLSEGEHMQVLAPAPHPWTTLPEGERMQVLAPAPRRWTTLPEGERMQVAPKPPTTTSVILQGSDTAALVALVEGVGGKVTHKLDIIDAV